MERPNRLSALDVRSHGQRRHRSCFWLACFVVSRKSPRWLAKKWTSREKARDVLAKIGGEKYAAQALDEINATLVNEGAAVDFRELLDQVKMKKVLVLGIGLAVFQQWCGTQCHFQLTHRKFLPRSG